MTSTGRISTYTKFPNRLGRRSGERVDPKQNYDDACYCYNNVHFFDNRGKLDLLGGGFLFRKVLEQ